MTTSSDEELKRSALDYLKGVTHYVFMGMVEQFNDLRYAGYEESHIKAACGAWVIPQSGRYIVIGPYPRPRILNACPDCLRASRRAPK